MFHVCITHHTSLQHNSILLVGTKQAFFAVEIAKADFPPPPNPYQFFFFILQSQTVKAEHPNGV